MAHLLLIFSGLAEGPTEDSPLALGTTPTLDAMARRSEVGLVQPVPDAPTVGVDLTTAALLGYNPAGLARGPLEVLGAGPSLDRRDVGARLDLISLSNPVDPRPTPPTADEAAGLWRELCGAISTPRLAVRGVRPTTALAVWNEGPVEVRCVPPGELTDADAQLPSGEREAEVRRIIEISRELLADHDLNRARADQGLPTLDALWPWGLGRAPELPLFVLRTGQMSSLISDNLAVRGVARACGLNAPRAGAERTLAGVAEELLARLDHATTVISQSSAADTLAHAGDQEKRVDLVSALDRHVLAPLWARAEGGAELDITVLCDYACSAESRRHVNQTVPYLAWRHKRTVAGPERFTELWAADTGRERHGHEAIRSWLWRS